MIPADGQFHWLGKLLGILAAVDPLTPRQTERPLRLGSPRADPQARPLASIRVQGLPPRLRRAVTRSRCPVESVTRQHGNASRFLGMATIVLRVRLIGGERMDLTYEEPEVAAEGDLIEHVLTTLAQDSGVLRSRHGDRLVVLYGRGVAAIEVAPRGAVV